MYLRKAITLQVDSFHNSNDLYKISDTGTIYIDYQPLIKVFKNCEAEFFKYM